MTRILQTLNFLGVIALVVLCAFQWRANGRVNQEADNLQRIREDQAAKLTDQDKALKADTADLKDTRDRLTECDSTLKQTEKKLTTSTADRDRLSDEVNQFTKAMEQWKSAVAARDQLIKQQNEKLVQAYKDRNDAVVKFNDLANKYNALVKSVADRQ